MQPPPQHARISLAELKAQMVRKLGPERSQQYFYYFNKFLSLKMNKVEFNKICLRIVGRENIPLHNQLIRSILKNSLTAKFPPSEHEVEVSKGTRSVTSKEEHSSNLYQQNNGSLAATNLPSSHAALSNGDMLPLSPKKARTGTRERRGGDRRSAFGQNGKTNFISQQSPSTQCSGFTVDLGNGESSPPNIQPVHRHQGLKQQPENEEVLVRGGLAKLSTVSADDTVSVHSNDHKELLGKTDWKELSARRLLHPPLGIPFCISSVGGARRSLPLASNSKVISSLDSGDLLDIAALREQMEQIATSHGLEGVSVDCANMLNNGLNNYLKGLVRSSLTLMGARSGHGSSGHKFHKHQAPLKLGSGMHEHIPHCSISLLDFKTAMELNPQQLGEDWPLLLEKICTYAFDKDT